jgi:hypothetical protein
MIGITFLFEWAFPRAANRKLTAQFTEHMSQTSYLIWKATPLSHLPPAQREMRADGPVGLATVAAASRFHMKDIPRDLKLRERSRNSAFEGDAAERTIQKDMLRDFL